MLFSLNWLRELCPVEDDAERIVDALTSRGLTVDSVEPQGSDHVLDVDVPANRPDCLGHLGLAREISAALGRDLAGPVPEPEATGRPAGEEVSVEIADDVLCPRYVAAVVRNVTVGPSPRWVVRRLETCGLRSVNNVVDASNLVLLGLGQPIHFFDLDRLEPGDESGRALIRIRAANAGERLTTLDGVERKLDPDMLVIADSRQAIALAGVIGGAETEIGPATRDVLIEAARFDPQSIRRTSRRLGIRTDAGFRFERGGDFEGPPLAADLAIRLLHELGGGKPAPQRIDACPGKSASATLTLRPSAIRRLLGFQPDAPAIREALVALGLSPEGEDPITITVPSWRSDLDREADLVEEVARHLGYDSIPTRTSGLPTGIEPSRLGDRSSEERSRDVLCHLGFHEALGYAMIGAGDDDPFVDGGSPPLGLTNPIAEPLSLLRRSILPGLLRAVDLNLRRGTRDVRLFEVGRVFIGRGPGEFPDESLRLGFAWSGAAEPRHWSRKFREVDLYDVIGVVEHLLGDLHPDPLRTTSPGAPPAFHPGRSLTWRNPDGVVVAWGGALHPERQAEIDQPVYLAEVDLGRVALRNEEPRQHAPVPRLPAVSRDLSLVLRSDITYRDILEILRSVPPPAPVLFEAIDRYCGPPLADGEVSLTVRLILRPRERTLTDPETDGYREALIHKLREAMEIRIRA